ncbi:MAG: NADH-quinone oxidoreductase subunit NuoE [candidate division KSB1 bacterium]|nr:NADH-quinone oxidoreductase subunit NuoE [candidate division KSB1 bacterium]MDZ7334975.1 NADH-quinone oxidoreductase subunit NuoE [candidate division KSB1 bacterium]MDZ7358640.1 NADH-quinone oxidoreductase subunit NuoE [candidate division KSB1 bacterium]MDZ7401748.1 NADH-quinone oxidoreductase subunit NuoE [candidate division KSB1 bacterium]
METAKLDEIIAANGSTRAGIISILHEIQAQYNYLPEQPLRYVAQKLNIPLIDIYSIASFYHAFSLKPRGKHLIQCCLGTACHVRGSHRVLDELERRLGIRAGETTPDNQFTLKTVNCLGACALGPIVVVDQDYHGNTRVQKVAAILAKYSDNGTAASQ